MSNQFPVPQATIEAGLLGSVLSSIDDWVKLEEAGLRQEDFTAHREIYVFIKDYLIKFGNLPTSGQIGSHFEWQPTPGDFAYWLQEMRRYTLARQVLGVINTAYEKIADPEGTLQLMIEQLSMIRSEQTNHIQAYDADAAERMEKYMARQEFLYNGKGILGLRTGHWVIDDSRIGWLPGSMVGVYARPGVGKTWWLLWQGMHTWMAGKRVLALTPEMPANMLDLRVDVLAGAQLGYPIEYNKLLIGHPDIQENYHRILDILTQSKRWWTYDSLNEHSVGLGDLVALTRQHEPDIILIDGVSLMKAETRGQVWEQMRELCYGIKTIATIHNVPILVTHQAVNSARGRRTEVQSTGRGDDFIMPSLNDAAYGDAFVQACSDVITMVADSQFEYIRWFSIRKHRERGWQQELPTRMALAWDPGRGMIVDLSRLGYDPGAIGEEARRILNIHV